MTIDNTVMQSKAGTAQTDLYVGGFFTCSLSWCDMSEAGGARIN